MPKIIVTRPGGVKRSGQTLAPGEHEVPGGPHLDAWLRFGQAKLVEEKDPKAPKKASEK